MNATFNYNASQHIGIQEVPQIDNYSDLMSTIISEFNNDLLSYVQMLSIAAQEVQLLLIAVQKNGNKINVPQLAKRNIRLAILNQLNKIAA
ncbi:hypothetical protein DBR32_05240 [Taibaiella sp. KBW10]|uniref:hypothetical protein n=1 Tax=Taibaiella sp. KBW10 TaxID=2153357 RepID=UPI000F592F6D|nr:hypothetical protein [Taibaiella sp. KBW10]RQO31369.1 hypothetical protein DBR32_05240 [Taibaiella sp. KBW10]